MSNIKKLAEIKEKAPIVLSWPTTDPLQTKVPFPISELFSKVTPGITSTPFPTRALFEINAFSWTKLNGLWPCLKAERNSSCLLVFKS